MRRGALLSLVTVLELDHVFCIVADPGEAARRLEGDGWVLDAGQAHRGQGTRNRRLLWSGQFFELVWITDVGEARANPLRLDRRADWATTGASPFGLAFRGRITPARSRSFGSTTHSDRASGFIATTSGSRNDPWCSCSKSRGEEMGQRRRRADGSMVAHRQPGELREVRVHGPSAPSLPPFAGPPIVYMPGPPALELVVGTQARARSVSDALAIVW